MKGKKRFTLNEANQIRVLLRAKSLANRSDQKRIRGRMRDLGFYITDFENSQSGFSEQDFDNLIQRGAITILDEVKMNRSTTKYTRPVDDSIQPSQKDEAYIIDLCDRILKQVASRQHRFSFLHGDAGTALPVDAYYSSLNLAIEYSERQHTETVAFFDKPNRLTVSGVHRGEQRKIYDQRRRDVLPKHGIELVELSYSDFSYDERKRLIRNKEADLEVLRRVLAKWIK